MTIKKYRSETKLPELRIWLNRKILFTMRAGECGNSRELFSLGWSFCFRLFAFRFQVFQKRCAAFYQTRIFNEGILGGKTNEIYSPP
jgi:hypothetical protein